MKPSNQQLPNKQNAQQPASMQQAQLLITESHGPLPHPEILRGYDGILPGAADRILTMAEKESEHRHCLEKAQVRMESRDSFCGLLFGFVIGMASVLGGTFCVLNNHDLGGSLLSLTGLSGLVGVFVYGAKNRVMKP